ncbi:MAG: hydroxyacid dehydrogenase [Paenibacillus sp.]|nr:hydroxyacid dehydrogenase [Paenibacillus sp.]
MTGRQILVLQKLDQEQMDTIRRAAPGWDVITADQPLEDSHYREAEVICGWNAKAKQLSLEPGTALKWLQTWGAGIEKLPLEAIKRRGVWLTNASGVHAYPISESVFAMLLSFTRQLHRSVRNQMERKWQPGARLDEAHGRTIGILGVGEIGAEVAIIAKAFGMTVLGVRRSEAAAESVDRMTTFAGLAEVLSASDYIVNCLPLTEETKHIINRDSFRLMKPNAFYINIGRGGTTDTEALVDALREGLIAGATPHHTGSTSHYNRRVVDIFATNLSAYAAGRVPPVNLIAEDRMY